MSFSLILILVGLILGQVVRVPFIENSGFTFLDLSVIFFILINLIRLKLQLKKPPLPLLLFGLFILIAIISSLFSPLTLTFSERIIGFAYLIRLIIYFLAGWIVFDQHERLSLLIPKIFITASVILAILGLLQLIFIPNLQFLQSEGWDPHKYRTVSTFLDPNFLGGFLVLGLLLIFTKITQKSSQVLIIAFIVVYLATLTTFSRSTALMFSISFISFAFLKKSVHLSLFILVLILGFIITFIFYNQTISLPNNVDRQQSAEYRINSYQQGYTIFTHFPILGVGFNNYRYALKNLNLIPKEYLSHRGSSANDSSLLFIASTTGIIGLIIFLAFLFTLIKTSLQNTSTFKIAFLSGLMGLLVHSLFVNSLFYPWFLIWIMFMAGLISVHTKS